MLVFQSIINSSPFEKRNDITPATGFNLMKTTLLINSVMDSGKDKSCSLQELKRGKIENVLPAQKKKEKLGIDISNHLHQNRAKMRQT